MFPFIGFGFLDNFIMIIAGESIEANLGVTFHLSVMACAALGNTISDAAGVGLAGYVEVLCIRMGLPIPNLTPAETVHSRVNIFENLKSIRNRHRRYFWNFGFRYKFP
jgi:hypothetical protein